MLAVIKNIQSGDRGIKTTVIEAQKLIKKSLTNPDFVNFARSIVRSCSPKDYLCEGKSIFNWVKENIRYVKDPLDVELIQSPENTLKIGQEDCDGLSILLSALYQAIGHPTRLVTISQDSERQFSHIYPEVYINGEWIAADVTPKNSFFGWTPERYTRRKIWMEKGNEPSEGAFAYIGRILNLQGLSDFSTYQDFFNSLNDWQKGVIQNILIQASDYASTRTKEELVSEDMFKFIRERFTAITGLPYTNVNYGRYSTAILGALNHFNNVISQSTGSNTPSDDQLISRFYNFVLPFLSSGQSSDLLKFYLANYSNHVQLTSQQQADLKSSYENERSIALPAFQAVADENTIRDWKNIWANSLPKLSSISSFFGSLPKYALLAGGVLGGLVIYKFLRK